MTVKPTTRAPHFGNKSSESRSTSPGIISFIVTNMNVPEGKVEHVISHSQTRIVREMSGIIKYDELNICRVEKSNTNSASVFSIGINLETKNIHVLNQKRKCNADSRNLNYLRQWRD